MVSLTFKLVRRRTSPAPHLDGALLKGRNEKKSLISDLSLTPPTNQIGGGIVFDSIEEDEYVETLNKLKANLSCIEKAEGKSASFSLNYTFLLLPRNLKYIYIYIYIDP